jgi:hypothetical protein
MEVGLDLHVQITRSQANMKFNVTEQATGAGTCLHLSVHSILQCTQVDWYYRCVKPLYSTISRNSEQGGNCMDSGLTFNVHVMY